MHLGMVLEPHYCLVAYLGGCSVLEVLGTVFDCWVSILWGEGTPNDGMRETVWVLGKYPNDAV